MAEALPQSSPGEKRMQLEDFIAFNLSRRETAGDSEVIPALVTSSSHPFHIEWVNSSWSKTFGWSSEDIQGLDCKFLQGEATDEVTISRFMEDLVKNGGYAEMKIRNYRKDDCLLHCTVKCRPLIDAVAVGLSSSQSGRKSKNQVCHIGIIIVDARMERGCGHDNNISTGIAGSTTCSNFPLIWAPPHSPSSFSGPDSTTTTSSVSSCSDKTTTSDSSCFFDIGLPLDRRENCRSYLKCGDLSPPGVHQWRLLSTDGWFSLSLMLRYMLRSQAPLILIERESHRIVHMNISFCYLTELSNTTYEGVDISKMVLKDSPQDKSMNEDFCQVLYDISYASFDKIIGDEKTKTTTSAAVESGDVLPVRTDTLVSIPSRLQMQRTATLTRGKPSNNYTSGSSRSSSPTSTAMSTSPRCSNNSSSSGGRGGGGVTMVASPVRIGSQFMVIMFSFPEQQQVVPQPPPPASNSDSSSDSSSDNSNDNSNDSSLYSFYII